MALLVMARRKQPKAGKENVENKPAKQAAGKKSKGLKAAVAAPPAGGVDLRPNLVDLTDAAEEEHDDGDDIISPILSLPHALAPAPAPKPAAAAPIRESPRVTMQPKSPAPTGPFELAQSSGHAALAAGPKDSSEYVRLEDWSFAFNASRPLQLTGRVFHGMGGFDDGDLLEYTSQLIAIDGLIATTKSGTIYTLGKPGHGFEQLRTQLWISSRTGRPKFDDGSSVPPLNPERPLMGIKLGDVVAAAPVKLPKVVGWSHQSGVALLNEWSTRRAGSEDDISVVGTVYNCPGAYDGAEGHMTSKVIDCKGRILKTVEGAEFYLGYRKEATAEQRAAMAIGELQNAEGIALGFEEAELAV